MNFLGCYSPLLTRDSSYKLLIWTSTWDCTLLMSNRPLLINFQQTNIAPWSRIIRVKIGLTTRLQKAVQFKTLGSLDLPRRRLTLPVRLWSQRLFFSTIMQQLSKNQLPMSVTLVTHQENKRPDRLNTTRSKINTAPLRRKRLSRTTTRWNMSQISMEGWMLKSHKRTFTKPIMTKSSTLRTVLHLKPITSTNVLLRELRLGADLSIRVLTIILTPERPIQGRQGRLLIRLSASNRALLMRFCRVSTHRNPNSTPS